MRKIKPVKVFLSQEKELFDTIRNIFGFYPGNIFLYKLAFRHKSAAEERFDGLKISNERLEYLGDAVLSLVIADYLFKIFPFKDEGFLTEMRSKIVSRSQLNSLAKRLGFDRLIMSTQNGVGLAKSIYGDAFEAFIGAVYLDKGYTFVKKLIINHIINLHLDIDEIESLDINFKSRLLEWCQKNKQEIEFDVVGEEGNGYKKLYVVVVNVDGKTLGQGKDHSIKGAEQMAAEEALEKINHKE